MKVELAAAKKQVAALKSKAYDGELAETIAKSNIVSEFDKIKARYKTYHQLTFFKLKARL